MADSVANVIFRKKIKVDSRDVQRIKKEILEDMRDGEKKEPRDAIDEKDKKIMKMKNTDD